MEQWFPMILGSSAKIFIDRHPLDPVQQYLAFMYNSIELLCTTVRE